MKITVRKAKNNSKTRWFVDYTPAGGKRKREIFKTQALANAHKATLEDQKSKTGETWLALPASERAELISVLGEVEGAGLTMRAVWEAFKKSGARPDALSSTLGDAYKKFIEEKERALLAKKSITWYKSGLGRFVSGRETVEVRAVTRKDVFDWLDNPNWGPRSFNAHRAGLHIFFDWCRKLKYCEYLPTDSIERISEKRMPDIDKPPVVLSFNQAFELLRATMIEDPAILPYVAVGAFAGLRPESEAAKLGKDDVQTAQGLIHVRGANAKDRQQRYVEMHPTLKAWLDLGGDYRPKNLRRRFMRVRARAGLIKAVSVRGKRRKADGTGFHRHYKIENTGWDQDCLRHTFASNYLQVTNADKTIAAMGHGDYDMLFKHYRNLVTPADAAKFWTLAPAYVIARLFEPVACLQGGQVT